MNNSSLQLRHKLRERIGCHVTLVSKGLSIMVGKLPRMDSLLKLPPGTYTSPDNSVRELDKCPQIIRYSLEGNNGNLSEGTKRTLLKMPSKYRMAISLVPCDDATPLLARSSKSTPHGHFRAFVPPMRRLS